MIHIQCDLNFPKMSLSLMSIKWHLMDFLAFVLVQKKYYATENCNFGENSFFEKYAVTTKQS